MIKRICKAPFLRILTVAVLVFAVIAICTNAKPLAECVRLIQISMAGAVVLAYAPEAGRAALAPRLTTDDLLILGIWFGWFGGFWLGMWLLVWRLGGQPSWMVNSDVTNSLLALQTLGATLHLGAPNAIGGEVPTRNMVRIGATTGLGLLLFLGLALYSTTYSPGLARLLQNIRPYIEDKHNHYDAPTNPVRFDVPTTSSVTQLMVPG